MKKRKGAITAEELLRKLEHDKDYQERKKKREAEFEIIKKNRVQAEPPLVADIRKLGFDISSVYDFVNSANSYAAAIPTLVHYLESDLISEPVIKEGIIRALTVKEAKGIANDVLLATYHKIPNEIKDEEQCLVAHRAFLMKRQKTKLLIMSMFHDVPPVPRVKMERFVR